LHLPSLNNIAFHEISRRIFLNIHNVFYLSPWNLVKIWQNLEFVKFSWSIFKMGTLSSFQNYKITQFIINMIIGICELISYINPCWKRSYQVQNCTQLDPLSVYSNSWDILCSYYWLSILFTLKNLLKGLNCIFHVIHFLHCLCSYTNFPPH
jgi:hypothetical protein